MPRKIVVTCVSVKFFKIRIDRSLPLGSFTSRVATRERQPITLRAADAAIVRPAQESVRSIVMRVLMMSVITHRLIRIAFT
jgi:hypothetical protein